MERLTYTWFVAYFMYDGRDGRKYFCALPKRYSSADNLALITCDPQMWRLSPCKSRKDAFAIANALNADYRRDGRLATMDNLYEGECKA